MHKLADLQKLRAFAILMVLLGHTGLAMPNRLIHGYTGVSLFFVISGYVVTLSILRSEPRLKRFFSRSNWEFLRDFYIRRVFRIIPVAAFWMLFSLVAVQVVHKYGGTVPWKVGLVREIKWMLSGFYNYQFAAVLSPAKFGHYWSLAVEMHFYLMLPLLLLVVRKKQHRVAMCIGAVILVSTLLRALTPPTQIGFLTHTQADALFMGVLMGVLFFPDGATSPVVTRRIAVPFWAKNLVFISLSVGLLVLPSLLDGVWSPIHMYPLYTLLASAMVFLAQRNTGWVLGGMPQLSSFFSYLGDRSYSLYILHPILWLGVYPLLYSRFSNVLPGWLSSPGAGVAVQALTMFLGALAVTELSYQFIEKPYLNYGRGLVRSLNRSEELAAVPASE